MKTIYLDIAGRMHSLYKELTSYPPPGYQFITQNTGWDKLFTTASRVNAIYSLQQRALGKVIPVNLAKAYLERLKKPPQGTDLTYATGHLVFRKEPWVVDSEFVTHLAGYDIGHFKRYKKVIERALSSEYCKKIICWTNAGRRTVVDSLNSDAIVQKVETVPLAARRKNFIRDYSNKGKIRLLFVGSANIPGEFEINGGKEAIEAFILLKQRYDDLELVVRSDMPGNLKNRYRQISNIKIIDEIIPWEQLEEEFKSADIFLFPAHTTPGMVILDAMSYELPVITTDVWANPEMVEDGKTGFLIKKSGKVQYYTENFIPIWTHLPNSPFMKSIRVVDPKVIQELVEKTSILIENQELRGRMGKRGRQEIETGRFSIERRNEKLKRIFDEGVEELNLP